MHGDSLYYILYHDDDQYEYILKKLGFMFVMSGNILQNNKMLPVKYCSLVISSLILLEKLQIFNSNVIITNAILMFYRDNKYL